MKDFEDRHLKISSRNLGIKGTKRHLGNTQLHNLEKPKNSSILTYPIIKGSRDIGDR